MARLGKGRSTGFEVSPRGMLILYGRWRGRRKETRDLWEPVELGLVSRLRVGLEGWEKVWILGRTRSVLLVEDLLHTGIGSMFMRFY